jgi:hypothetical protein
MKKKRNNTTDVRNTKLLAELVYNKAIREEIRKEIEERIKSKYLKRIDYLVGANNELMKELEQYERVSMAEKV